MDFYAILDQVVDLLRQRQRMTYRALKVQFQLDDEALEALKEELLEAQHLAAEESVRTLIESQVVVGEPGAYRLAQALPTMQVPATVQAVLAARMDRLPAEEKTLLQTAAVIGKDVPLALLQAITELSEETLRRALAHLQTAEFFCEVSLFP